MKKHVSNDWGGHGAEHLAHCEAHIVASVCTCINWCSLRGYVCSQRNGCQSTAVCSLLLEQFMQFRLALTGKLSRVFCLGTTENDTGHGNRLAKIVTATSGSFLHSNITLEASKGNTLRVSRRQSSPPTSKLRKRKLAWQGFRMCSRA